ncbi:hypothetical protein ABT246_35270 [Streptomyces sp. NPDC001553]|uniref:hypothetical protein n=1 Tax=Streptomyces sp. NPDC001553 TaxID=3154385 RepID=UPI00332736F9
MTACFAPEAAAAFAVPPISRATRSRTTAAASNPEGVNDQSFSVIRRPSGSTRVARPAETTRPPASKSLQPPRTVAASAVPGHTNNRI